LPRGTVAPIELVEHRLVDQAFGEQIEAGRLRPLAAVSDRRLPSYPSMPTMAEQGFPNYDLAICYGLVAVGYPA
jgi:hypothetical protein